MAFTRASLIKVEIYRNMKGSHFIFCIIFKSNVFLRLLYAQRTRLTTHVPSLEHTQSLHYMNIRQFFTCLNCIPPTKFTSTRARLLFTIYDLFPRESSQCIINFWFSWECHAMVKTSVWSWNKKWVICILSRSSEHLCGSEKFLTLAIPSSKRCF